MSRQPTSMELCRSRSAPGSVAIRRLASSPSMCSAADAECLREIRDKKHYRAIGLTWEEFCSRHAGVDRKTADRIVERLQEFGEAYFNLSQIMPIQPARYRQLAANVTGNTLEFDGRKIPITPEHAPEIVDAVRTLQSRLASEQSKTHCPYLALANRLDRCHAEFAGAARRGVNDADRALLIAILTDAISRFEEVSIAISSANLAA